jgi:hypothetical protein
MPHIEYLESVVNDRNTSLTGGPLAQQMLESEIRLTSHGCGSPSRDPTLSRLEESYGFPDAPAPRYVLPRPSTGAELVAAVMMVEGHLKAADLGVNLGTHLTDALFWLREPESRLRQRLVGGRSGRSIRTEDRGGDAPGGSDRGGGARAHRRPGTSSRQDRSDALSVLRAGVSRRVMANFAFPTTHQPRKRISSSENRRFAHPGGF